MSKVIIAVMLGLCVLNAHADITQQFKNPAFSGQGWSSHVLTVESIEKSRKDQLAADRKAIEAALAAAKENTPLSRFLNLFQSQVYAQLATQLSNNLFKNTCTTSDGAAIPGCVSPTTGVFTLDGNTITWVKNENSITLTVVDSIGTKTTVTVPIASFGF